MNIARAALTNIISSIINILYKHILLNLQGKHLSINIFTNSLLEKPLTAIEYFVFAHEKHKR